jgi:hypothetical protein
VPGPVAEWQRPHHIAAYNTGALAPMEPHEEPVELLSDDESV